MKAIINSGNWNRPTAVREIRYRIQAQFILAPDFSHREHVRHRVLSRSISRCCASRSFAKSRAPTLAKAKRRTRSVFTVARYQRDAHAFDTGGDAKRREVKGNREHRRTNALESTSAAASARCANFLSPSGCSRPENCPPITRRHVIIFPVPGAGNITTRCAIDNQEVAVQRARENRNTNLLPENHWLSPYQVLISMITNPKPNQTPLTLHLAVFAYTYIITPALPDLSFCASTSRVRSAADREHGACVILSLYIIIPLYPYITQDAERLQPLKRTRS